MKYLITGAAGFIGARTAELLLEKGHEVVAVDNLNDYYDTRLKYHRLHKIAAQVGADAAIKAALARCYLDNTPYSGPNLIEGERFSFQSLDIEDRSGIFSLFSNHRFDAVINLAARAGVRYSMENPTVYMTTNSLGTLNLMDGMKNSGVKKLVLASTSSLYAGQQMPFNEDLPVNTPISPYAASKKAAEALAHSYHYLYNLDVSIVRYFTVFGPAGRPDMCIFRFIKWIDEGVPLELFGDGTQSRDFTYVDDIALGTIAALKLVGYEIFNLGGGRNPISLNQIIEWIEEMLERKSSRTNAEFHKADIKETWADISKAAKMLAWAPKTEIKQGVQSCVSWHIANRDWLNRVRL